MKHEHIWRPPFGWSAQETHFRQCHCGAYGWLIERETADS